MARVSRKIGPIWADTSQAEYLAGESEVPVFIADSRKKRNVGLLHAETTNGVVWITKCNSIHTIGMKFDIEVAYLDKDNRVRDIVLYRTWRIGWPRFSARSVLEATPGVFAELNLSVGSKFEFRKAG